MIYLIRQIKPHRIQLAKFDDHKEPENVYEIDMKTQYCDCPSQTKPCKHYDMVVDWLKKDKSMYIDNKLVKNPALDDRELKKLLKGL